MEKLKVEGNKIVNEEGEEVILKGVNINSPGILKYEENHDFLQDIKEIKKLGANAIRVPICPAYFQSVENYCEEILDPIVNLCNELELYCILDNHSQGNPIKGLTREPKILINNYKKYDANYDYVKNITEELVKKYGKEEHVIFEPISAFFLEVTKEEWISVSNKLSNLIRNYSANLIMISSEGWPQNLEFALGHKPNTKNIAYGIMIYPGTTKEIKDVVIEINKKYPIIITECGYENINPKEDVLAGDKKYATEFTKFIFEHKLSWFAWCYHPTRQPVLIRSWNPEDLSEWGEFVKYELLENKK